MDVLFASQGILMFSDKIFSYVPMGIVKTLFFSFHFFAVLSHSVVSDFLWPHGTVAHQAPLSMGILQARILEWVAYPFSGGICLTWRSNRCLLHCRRILYQLRYQGSPLVSQVKLRAWLSPAWDFPKCYWFVNQKTVVNQEHNFKWALSLKEIMWLFFCLCFLLTIKGISFSILCLEIHLSEFCKLWKHFSSRYVSCSVMSDALWPIYCPWDFPGKNTGVGGHFLLQGLFPIQGSNPGILGLLYRKQILYCWTIREATNITPQ